mgnify:FL=1
MNKIHDTKNISVTNAIDEQGLIFKGEVNDFEEMVGNIMENAAKWANKDIIVKCHKDADRIVIEVTDDGPGIEKSKLATVFARGSRLDEETPGSGLGLSIVKDLAGLYGGNIILSDNANLNTSKGLLATLILPSI